MSFSDVSSATNHFSTAYEGFTTTTSGTVASGATSVGLNSVAGLTNGSVFVGVIEPAGTKEQVFTGVVDTSGSQITSVVWTKGTNVDHSTGVTVVDYDSGTHHNLITKGIKVEHLQSGAHGAITATSVTSAGTVQANTALKSDVVSEKTAANGVAVDGMTIKDGLVVGGSGVGIDNTSLNTAAGKLGAAWTSFTPSWTNLTVGSGTNSSSYVQVGKTVIAKLNFTFAANTSMGSNPKFTLPVMAAAANANTTIGNVEFTDANGSSYMGMIRMLSTTEADIVVGVANATYTSFSGLSSTIPFTWTTSDRISGIFIYEAA